MLSLLPKVVLLSSSSKTLSFYLIPPNSSQSNYDFRLVNHWIILKFQHHLQKSFSHIYTIGICEIMFVEIKIPLAQK